MNEPLEFPKDMPEHVRRAIGKPTADAIRAWQITAQQRRAAQLIQRAKYLAQLRHAAQSRETKSSTKEG